MKRGLIEKSVHTIVFQLAGNVNCCL